MKTEKNLLFVGKEEESKWLSIELKGIMREEAFELLSFSMTRQLGTVSSAALGL